MSSSLFENSPRVSADVPRSAAGSPLRTPAEPARRFERRLLSRGKNILITGVTGLIGGEIVRRLLPGDIGSIHCLIRSGPEHDARSRLEERVQVFGDGPSSRWNGRLHAVAGDVAARRLGMSPAQEEEIADSVDMIVHCASELSFIRDANCRETNINGMRNLIELAGHCRRNPLIVHLSTAASCGAISHRCVSEDYVGDPGLEHHNEYTRSKAMAEQVLREAHDTCLILRPSITLSAGVQARKFAGAMAWFVPLLNEFEALPIDPESRVDIVPVTFVADAIVRLLHKPHLRHDCYNISAGPDHAMICRELVGLLDAYFKRPTSLQLIAPSNWSKDLHRRYLGRPQQRKLFSTFRYYLPFLNMNVAYDNTRLRAELGDAFPEITPVRDYMDEQLDILTRGDGNGRHAGDGALSTD